MFGKLFGKKKATKPKKPKKADVVITVDYITAAGQKKYDEFDKFSLRMGDLGLGVDTSEFSGDEGAIYYKYEDEKNYIEIFVTVGVNVKINRNYETTIDYFDYSVDAHFDEETFVVDGGKKPEKVLAEVEKLIAKAKAMQG
tara:strand:+ start:280 stop:702 length:423 start_codon:yes stop_codon:yes gene_type:complete